MSVEAQMRFTPGSQLATILHVFVCVCVLTQLALWQLVRRFFNAVVVVVVVSLVAYFFGPVYGLIDKLQRCNYFS